MVGISSGKFSHDYRNLAAQLARQGFPNNQYTADLQFEYTYMHVMEIFTMSQCNIYII